MHLEKQVFNLKNVLRRTGRRLFYKYLISKTDRLVLAMEEKTIEVVDVLAPTREPARSGGKSDPAPDSDDTEDKGDED